MSSSYCPRFSEYRRQEGVVLLGPPTGMTSRQFLSSATPFSSWPALDDMTKRVHEKSDPGAIVVTKYQPEEPVVDPRFVDRHETRGSAPSGRSQCGPRRL